MYKIDQAILSALFVGLTFTVNLLTIKLILNKYKFPPLQLNYDVNFWYGAMLTPYLIYDISKNGQYPLKDLIFSGFAFFLTNYGVIFSILAIENGNAGIV
jgi:hypothetical protein